jgi:hypothetical protein
MKLAAEQRARMSKMQARVELRGNAAAQIETANQEAAAGREAVVWREATKTATSAITPKLAEFKLLRRQLSNRF